MVALAGLVALPLVWVGISPGIVVGCEPVGGLPLARPIRPGGAELEQSGPDAISNASLLVSVV